MPSALARHWTLDPEVTFLNHGSFGACPRVVLEAQQRIREEIEREPVRFFVRELPGRLDAARKKLAEFVGADPECLAPVQNATSAVNAVLRSLDFGPEDELLATDHAYEACRNALDFVAERNGAAVVVVPVPFPGCTPERIEGAILGAVTPRTRLALIDHVTSPTGMVLPVAAIVRGLRERGIDTLVDGAHAPGMVPLDLTALGSAYYAGHCHKWLCAPKGAAFLYVRPDLREGVRPLTISHGATSRRPGRSRFHDEFDWTGTDDPSAFLCVPDSIALLGSLLPGGWPEVMERNRALAIIAREKIRAALGVEAPCPDSMIGSLAALPLPDGALDDPVAGASSSRLDPLQNLLWERHRIEVPVVPWPARPKRLVRISAQLYNSEDQYERLAEAVREALRRTARA
jgi:isopenicillin-N epimerase